MRMAAPRVPSAASLAGSATIGPRLLPGTYTVKMTKDKAVYETPLQIVSDPRVKFTQADRQAQFDLSMKLYNMLGDMSTAVDRMNRMRANLNNRAARAADPALKSQLQAASAQVDDLRKKIVATKEGGAITGEERLREFLADLYGNVVRYEGRPAQTQVERTEALQRELAEVVKSYDDWSTTELPKINAAIAGEKLEPIN
jgi:hypothetical protein